MSTLLLSDLGPKMRRELGLEASFDCTTSTIHQLASVDELVVATIPIIEMAAPINPAIAIDDGPGAAWLRTGLHRLRLPQRNRQKRVTSLA